MRRHDDEKLRKLYVDLEAKDALHDTFDIADYVPYEVATRGAHAEPAAIPYAICSLMHRCAGARAERWARTHFMRARRLDLSVRRTAASEQLAWDDCTRAARAIYTTIAHMRHAVVSMYRASSFRSGGRRSLRTAS